MKQTVIIDGNPFDLELVRSSDGQRIEAEIDGKKYTLNVQAVETGVYWLIWNHRSIEISVTPSGDAYVASVDGRRVNVEIVDARAALRKAAQQGHAGTVALRAPMPGKIVKVLVSDGAAVETNQGLL